MENLYADQTQLILDFLKTRRSWLKTLYALSNDIAAVRSYILVELGHKCYNIEHALVMLSDDQLTMALNFPIEESES